VYQSPIPLAPDEARPLALTDFPGLAEQTMSGSQSLANLRPQALVDPAGSQPSEATTVWLEIEINAYEAVGGALYVHGTADNQSRVQVLEPTVIGALRSTSGEVWSAAEVSLGDALPSGSQASFLLVMPRPAGVEPSAGEFDIRGTGLAP
jgi:hypothetical protein